MADDEDSAPRLTSEQLDSLSSSLSTAIRACACVPIASRGKFLSKQLLALGRAVPAAEPPAAAVVATKDELSALALTLQTLLNETKGRPGWPLVAMAEALAEQHIAEGASFKPRRVASFAPSLVDTEAAPADADAGADGEAATAVAAPSAAPKKPAFYRVATDGFVLPIRRMSSFMTRRPTFKTTEPPSKDEPKPLSEKDAQARNARLMHSARTLHSARKVARDAFAKYDKDDSGTIDKQELFAVLLDLGRVVPVNGTPEQKAKFLDQAFAVADADDNGVVDEDEFIEFYNCVSVAYHAFNKYDKDGSGTIDKEELFTVLLDLGQVVPADGTPKQKREYLEATFALVDADGNGMVDVEEFLAFYNRTMQAIELENAARTKFAQYDVDHSNSLEKHELFRALLDFDLVPGFSLCEKREYLEEQFNVADTNGDGVVDFPEFSAFYTELETAAKDPDNLLERRRQLARRQKAERMQRQLAYRDADALFVAAQDGAVALLRGRWLLERCGYVETKRERAGRTLSKWARGRNAPASVPPLPTRQALEESEPSAFITVEELEEAYGQVVSTLEETGVSKARLDDFTMAPIILASHVWASTAHPDPKSETLLAIASQLAKDFPTFSMHGVADVGVFIDVCSLYQSPRTPEQDASFVRAKKQMGVWYAHQRTCVYLVNTPAPSPSPTMAGEAAGDAAENPPPLIGAATADAAEIAAATAAATAAPEAAPPVQVPPAHEARGWPTFERAVCDLFQQHSGSAARFTRPPKLKNGSVLPPWPKAVDVDLAADTLIMGERRRLQPPMAAGGFEKLMKALAFGDPEDAVAVGGLYRRVLEEGFNGMVTLQFSKLDWVDDDLIVAAETLQQVSCPEVTELNLSWNDFGARGLEAVGAAFAMGSMHGLKRLLITHCPGVSELPDGISALAELEELDISECPGLRALPSTFVKLISLKKLHLTNCHGLQGTKFAQCLNSNVEIVGLDTIA